MPRSSGFKPYDVIAINRHDFSVRSNGRNYTSDTPEGPQWRIGIIYHAENTSYPRISGVYLDDQGRPTNEGFDFHPDGENVQRVEFTKMNIQIDVPEKWRQGLVNPAPKPERTLRKDESMPELHPSYGTVTVSRPSGSMKLFMSPFRHQHAMCLSISRASRRRSLSDDRTFGEGELIQVYMSESQWARMVSSVGDGSGVPCTIQRVGGDMMPECPENDEKTIFQAEVEKAARDAAVQLRKTYEEVEKIMDKPSVTKADRKEILGKLSFAEKALSSSLPFVIQQFTERMGVITDDAKTEIQTFVDNTFRRAGLQALQDAGLTPISLPSPKKE